jgi:anthranilate synthase/aminodeoxychorismate synthase-like glutamine amidotransferase
MILLIDHDDSFVHILASYLAMMGEEPRVIRDEELTLAEVRRLHADGIVLSPGPGAPTECPLAIEVVRSLGGTVPILGVCLGHQVIAHALGATVTTARHPQHGITSAISHDGQGLFHGIANPTVATRYHSLAVDGSTLPGELQVTATAADGEVMGIRHRRWPVEGVQFHPESVLTVDGRAMLRNWLNRRTRSPGVSP